MSSTLEDLKTRLAIAHKALTEAAQQLQIAQQNQQKAASDFSVFNAAVAILTKEEEEKKAAANEKQLPMGLSDGESVPEYTPPGAVSSHGAETPPNKTELVRELLRHHMGGMTPTEIWKELRGQFVHRAYLYSVLKRLRDRDEVSLRRNKYALKIKPAEAPDAINLQ
jgi:hypothetical protein